MKHPIFIILLALLLLHCKKKSDNPTPSIPSTPKPVVVEAPSHSCTVVKNVDSKKINSRDYQITYTSGLGMTIFNMTLMGEKQSGIAFNFDFEPQVKRYPSQKLVNYMDQDRSVYEPSNGEIEILKFDKKKNIISGTFHFTAINSLRGDTIHVNDGQFTNLKFKKISAGI